MTTIDRTTFDGTPFYILRAGNAKDVKDAKSPLSDFRQEKCNFPWTEQSLNGAIIVLKKGVYIDDGISINCVLWFMQMGATVIAESCWCIGEGAARIIADLKKSTGSGSCFLGYVTLNGFSGMGVSDEANRWLRSRKPSDETMAIYERYRESVSEKTQ